MTKLGTDSSNNKSVDLVNSPPHYVGVIEEFDAMYSTYGEETMKDFCTCCAHKYISRWRKKDGVRDLEKAKWYINRLLKLESGEYQKYIEDRYYDTSGTNETNELNG